MGDFLVLTVASITDSGSEQRRPRLLNDVVALFLLLFIAIAVAAGACARQSRQHLRQRVIAKAGEELAQLLLAAHHELAADAISSLGSTSERKW